MPANVEMVETSVPPVNRCRVALAECDATLAIIRRDMLRSGRLRASAVTQSVGTKRAYRLAREWEAYLVYLVGAGVETRTTPAGERTPMWQRHVDRALRLVP